MDGVLVNLGHHIKTHTGYSFGELPAGKMWQLISKHAPDLFVASLPLPDASVLMNGVLEFANFNGLSVEILTAVPVLKSFPDATQQKQLWLDKYFPNHGLKFKIGPFSKDKHKHASIGDILIDDSRMNIRDWTNAGGIAIHHVNALESLDRLKTVGHRRTKIFFE